jgi:hypothetical protein
MGGRVRYQENRHIAFGMDAAFLSFAGKEKNNPRIDVLPLSAIVEWRPVAGWTLHPYVIGGLGIARTTRHLSPQASGGQSGAVMLGFGVEVDLTPLASFSLEGLGRHVVNASPDGKDAQTASAGAFLNFYLPDVAVPVQTKNRRSLQDLDFAGRGARTAQSQEREELQKEITRIQEMITEGKTPPIAFERRTANLLFSSFETLDAFGTLLRRHMNVKIRLYGFEDPPVEATPAPPTLEDVLASSPTVPGLLPESPEPGDPAPTTDAAATEPTTPAPPAPEPMATASDSQEEPSDGLLPQARAEVVRAYLITNFDLKENRLFIAAPNERPLWAEWTSDGTPITSLRQMEFEAIP